ncbi:hypothetical protein bpr_I1642 [Butyrivibrio proteoclasticus B316]|uniref:DUF2953 domain-containing protein n=1 Tax=Butyrivibrio proteoclasticus (strain ATCC 51982 / DSM 14932 / B316) TaxID=515622 RepID=E0RWK5_BUTPB|nr:DUF2953 domain-containing protein [Butyrivibrio proteoclasticus]ADL34379.1 hypothetical protein bpr_I1642 [Butyrivibrio proteoclasticus B316]
MLTGLLTVLKIIGIALLVILALVLLILILVLFVPIRYKLDGTIPETDLEQGFDLEKIIGSASFSWLLHFISGGIQYPENKEFTVRIMGIKILPRKEKNKDKEKKKRKKEKSDSVNEDNSQAEDSIQNAEDIATEGNEDTSDDAKSDAEPVESGNTNSDESDKDSDSESDTNTRTDSEDKALIEIVQDIIDKVENILKTPQNVLGKIQYTISRVCGKIGMIKTTLENDIFKRAFELVKGKLIRMIRMILPDKSKVDLMLGLGDPADTAQAMAAYGALYPVLFKSVSFRPDFDRKVIYADAHFKGHITVFTILYCVCVCYFNKDVKKVIRRFKKIINS